MYKNHRANFHSHTYLCGHASGKAIDYVKEAVKRNYLELGISEHAPMDNLPNNNSRLKEEDFNQYLKDLKEAKKYANSNGLKFYSGLEIEYFKDKDIYEDFLKEVDYLILGQHYVLKEEKLSKTYNFNTIEEIIDYRDSVIDAINSGYFKLLCHLDLCFYNIDNPTNEMFELLRSVVKLAKEKDMIIELNANGIRKSFNKDNNRSLEYSLFKYPHEQFFKIVSEEGAKVLISSDAHSVKDLDDWAIEEAYKFAEKLNLNIVYTIF